MNDWLLLIMALLFTVFGHVNDAITIPKIKVGWLKRHLVYWLRRDIPMFILCCGWAWYPNLLRAVFIATLLIINALHSLIIKIVDEDVEEGKWDGSQTPWFWYRFFWIAGILLLTMVIVIRSGIL